MNMGFVLAEAVGSSLVASILYQKLMIERVTFDYGIEEQLCGICTYLIML
jgi:hypothetical protein